MIPRLDRSPFLLRGRSVVLWRVRRRKSRTRMLRLDRRGRVLRRTRGVDRGHGSRRGKPAQVFGLFLGREVKEVLSLEADAIEHGAEAAGFDVAHGSAHIESGIELCVDIAHHGDEGESWFGHGCSFGVSDLVERPDRSGRSANALTRNALR